MTILPDLPPMHAVNPWTEHTYDNLYAVFCDTIRGGKLKHLGEVVWHFPNLEDGKEEIFWHLTSREDKNTNERLPDLRRSECLPWVNPLLGACPHSDVLHWDYAEGDKTIHSYVWLQESDFVIVMKKYPDGRRRLITSYCVDQNHARRKLLKKYTERI